MTTLFENDFASVTSSATPFSSQNLPLLTLQHANCQATVSLYGGQVLSFMPSGEKEIFWLSEDALYQEGKAIRGGIPLCWPWFGANDQQTEQLKAPNHGFARQSLWQVKGIEADANGVVLILTLTGQDQHAIWPTAYQLEQKLFFGEFFEQSLTMTNLSDTDTQYSAALHSYFRVSQPENVQLSALTGVKYYNKLSDSFSVQEGEVSCVGEIDREYYSSEVMTLVDRQWQRKIVVESENCLQWVLWNPGTELANSMADVHQGGEQEYVCLEAANTQWQPLPAGTTVTIGQKVTVNAIAD